MFVGVILAPMITTCGSIRAAELQSAAVLAAPASPPDARLTRPGYRDRMTIPNDLEVALDVERLRIVASARIAYGQRLVDSGEEILSALDALGMTESGAPNEAEKGQEKDRIRVSAPENSEAATLCKVLRLQRMGWDSNPR